jgi:Predicted oxidoreductases of the aldo/keto reductase family
MLYYENPRNGDKLSKLGFGCMRLSGKEDDSIAVLRKAIDSGINYLDTAYIYQGNEALLGKALKDGYREKVKLATKLPFYFCKKEADIERMFQTQLTRLQTDSIDYYLIHMLNSLKDWERMTGLNIINWISEKKAAGQIKNIGFSFHGTNEEFVKLIDAYDWEFTLVQYNYIDENHQAGRKGIEYAYLKNVPVFIMEPLRGGKLAVNLPPRALDSFSAADASMSPAQYALKWLFDQKEIGLVLSGMKDEVILASNIEALSLPPLDEARQNAIKQACLAISETMLVPCTACGYCVPCPKGVDIPMCFAFYNDTTSNKLMAKVNYVMRAANHQASKCEGCGKCEKHCPQQIAIRQRLKDVEKAMEGFYYKPLRFIVNKALSRGK